MRKYIDDYECPAVSGAGGERGIFIHEGCSGLCNGLDWGMVQLIEDGRIVYMEEMPY